MRPNFRLKSKIRLPKDRRTNLQMKIEDWLRPYKIPGQPFSSGKMRWIIQVDQQKICRVSNKIISCLFVCKTWMIHKFLSFFCFFFMGRV